MKKMIMAVLVLASSFYATVQAGTGGKTRKAAKKEESVSSIVKESFERQFPQAQFASWQVLNQHDLYLVRFVDNEVGTIAYVTMEGNVIAVAHNILRENLPSTVNRVLETKYADAEVTEITELVLNGELNYFISLVNEKAKISLKVTGNGVWSETKREKLSKKAF